MNEFFLDLSDKLSILDNILRPELGGEVDTDLYWMLFWELRIGLDGELRSELKTD